MLKAPDESIKDEMVAGDISPTVVPASLQLYSLRLQSCSPHPNFWKLVYSWYFLNNKVRIF